ncbi:MAG: carboxymuconolactone decarboxylase family protein [Candidatus Hydrogenedentes bacterium]|nr:carboxymuconolactone decarboxylase family protein [Candidatus Hydrogenedentota bacterium]
MAHITPLSRSELPAFEMIFESAERALGAVPNSMLTMGRKPGILGAFSLLAGSVFHSLNQPFSFKQIKFFRAFMSAAKKPDPENSITPQLQQMVANVCSLSAGCRYCQAHTGEALHLMKVSDEKIQALLHYDTSDEFDDAERAALGLAFAAASVPNRSTPEHFAELRKHFNENQIVELVAVIALFGFLNRWNDTMATALEDAPLNFARATLAPAGWEAGKHG